ncbi:MAG: MJ0042-type zinc finger domain-containing protein [Thermodesulfobacteriota bacterium]
MVVKCSHCFGLMRVDDARIPAEKTVRVRCPHCRGIGTVGPLEPAALAQEDGPDIPGSVETAPTAGEKELATDRPQVLFDPLDDIRFPEEPRPAMSVAKSEGRWLTFAIWAGISLAVVGIFALLVNLVLPGPGKSKPTTEHIEPREVPQPDGLIGVGSGPQKPKPR